MAAGMGCGNTKHDGAAARTKNDGQQGGGKPAGKQRELNKQSTLLKHPILDKAGDVRDHYTFSKVSGGSCAKPIQLLRAFSGMQGTLLRRIHGCNC